MPNSLGSSTCRTFAKCAALLSALVALAAPAAHAETRVEGTVDSIRLEAHDASVQEVLTALGANFDLRFRSATPLDRTVSGSLKGPLRGVVARVLDGYDYIGKTGNGTMQVIVLGLQQQAQQISPLIGTMPQQASRVSPPVGIMPQQAQQTMPRASSRPAANPQGAASGRPAIQQSSAAFPVIVAPAVPPPSAWGIVSAPPLPTTPP
jgi:hypothetical protein